MELRRWLVPLVVATSACSPNTGGLGDGDAGMPVAGTSTGSGEDTTAASTSTTGTSDGAASGEGTSTGSGEGTTAALDGSTGGASTSVGATHEAESSSDGGPLSTLPELPCGEEGTLMSMSSAEPASVTFHNVSGEPRIIYWLDYSGERDGFGAMEPDDEWDFATFVTHPWLIADESDACLAIYITEAGDHDVWLD